MEPLQNSESYEQLVQDEDISKTSSLTDGAAPVTHGAKLDVLQRDMYRYKIHKHDQAKFYFQLEFAPKRVNLSLPGEFELVKIKSNGVDFIRIFIAEEQVNIYFHPLYDARKPVFDNSEIPVFLPEIVRNYCIKDRQKSL